MIPTVEPTVSAAGDKHRRPDRTKAHQPHSLKVFIVTSTEVGAPVFAPPHAPTFTQAAVRSAVSLAAPIGLSLLLAEF
jgi:hypothetical protein